jgi:hypothetical protein
VNSSATGPSAFFQASGITAAQNTSIVVGKVNTTNNAGTIVWNHVGDGLATNYLGLGYWGGDNKLNITAAGNVGVGLTAPARVLHVYSAATSGSGPFVVDQYAASGFADTVTLFRTAQAATNAFNMMMLQSSSGSNNLFYVRADGYVWAANDITAFSDARVKTNVKKIDSALDKVSQINGYTFNRVDSTEQKRSAGVIAQEVQKVLPEVVHEDKDGYLSVAYGNLTALLIEALKEERAAREALEERLKRLENR